MRRAEMRTVFLAALVLCVLPTACATGSGSEQTTRRSRDVITFEELASQPSLSAYEAIQRLRPAWLQSRGPMSGGGATRSYPNVMLDGVMLGDINTLRDLRTDDVLEFRFISARDATTRFGTGYMAGVIEVVTRR
jgi:hypothetical protein